MTAILGPHRRLATASPREQFLAAVFDALWDRYRSRVSYVRDYERLLTGGIWAQVDLRFEYDEETKGKYPFWI